jgi:hypothetical protein
MIYQSGLKDYYKGIFFCLLLWFLGFAISSFLEYETPYPNPDNDYQFKDRDFIAIFLTILRVNSIVALFLCYFGYF